MRGILNGRRRMKVQRTTHNVFVRGVPYSTCTVALIKGDFQSDEMDIFIQVKKKGGYGNAMFTASPRGGIWAQY
jgi:hypothetical protein